MKTMKSEGRLTPKHEMEVTYVAREGSGVINLYQKNIFKVEPDHILVEYEELPKFIRRLRKLGRQLGAYPPPKRFRKPVEGPGVNEPDPSF